MSQSADASSPASTLPDSLLTGENAAFLDQQYLQWQDDPSSVEPEIRATFEAIEGPPNGRTGMGPSFQSRSIFAPAGVGTDSRQAKVVQLVNAYRVRAHLSADVDPLGRKTKVVHDELDLDETRTVLFDTHERPNNLPPEFLWVQGDPTKQSELDKVRLTHANAVIVAGDRTNSASDADARTILTVFTIRAYLSQQAEQVKYRKEPLYVIAEILDRENVDHARTAGANEVVETRRLGSSMLAHATRFHGAASVMSRVLMAGDHNVYIGEIPDGLETYHDLLRAVGPTNPGVLCMGVRLPSGEDVINPPKATPLPDGAALIYLAEAPVLPSPR